MFSLLLLFAAAGRTFYVSPQGDDASEGLSQAHPWRTLARVSQAPLEPGDTVLLEGGASFTGSLALSRGGDGRRPVVIRSAGAPATILSRGAPAIAAEGGGFELRDLILRGGAHEKLEGQDGVRLRAPGKVRQAPVRIENVDIGGFGGSGISIEGAKDSDAGFDGVAIEKCKLNDNMDAGLQTGDGVAYRGKGFAHRNLLVRDCEASRNHGGSGIVISGFDGGVVEFCRAEGNSGKGGGVGIWAWCARRLTVRDCISTGTRTGGGDGGGFDLDGGCVDCVVEHCLTYDNDGPGYMHCDYPAAPRTEGNAIRASLSYDDGRKAKGDAIGFGFVTWGSGLYGCSIERNVAIVDEPGKGRGENGVLFVSYIRSSSDPVAKQRIDAGIFRGNDVQVLTKGAAFVKNDLSDGSAGKIQFEGNLFFGAAPFLDSGAGGRRYENQSGWPSQPGKPQPALKSAPFRDLRRLQPRELPGFFAKAPRFMKS